MADKTDQTGKTPSRSPVTRIRTLATAALTADEKIDQLDALLAAMTSALTGMESTMRYTEETLTQFNESLIEIDKLSPRLIAMVDRMEAMVTRVERLIDLAEMGTGPLTGPLTVADSAVRGVVGVITSKLGPKPPPASTAKPASAPKKRAAKKSQ